MTALVLKTGRIKLVHTFKQGVWSVWDPAAVGSIGQTPLCKLRQRHRKSSLNNFTHGSRCLTSEAFCSHLAGPVQVLPVLGQLVQRQESVAIASGAVAETVAFPEQAALPDDLGTVSRLLQVLLLLEDLPGHQNNQSE